VLICANQWIKKAMKYFYLFLILSPNLMLAQINDTASVLPSAEITAVRLSRYAVGQQQITIDSSDLKASPFQNLGDLLQNLTPLSIKAYGIGLSTATSRGTGSRHTALIWNGLNIQNGLIGLSDLSALEVGSVEKMSVKFGGSSALFGSGAIGGAIFLDNNIENTRGFSGNIGTNAGSFGLFGQNIKLKIGNENASGQVRISHQKALNNFEFRDKSAFGKPIKNAENAAFDKLNLTNSLFFNLGKNRFLKINSWFTDIYREIPPTMTSRVDSARQFEQTFRSVAEFSGPLSINAFSSIFKARIGYFNERLNYESDIVKNSENNIRTFIAETETVFNFTEKRSLRLGLNYTNNKTFANNLGDINHKRNRFAVFASQIFEMKKTKFAANIRQEVVDNQLVPFVFSLGFERAISDKPLAKSFRGSFSRNYNLPALNDLYWNILGNPNLLAERGFSGELGIDFLRKNTDSETKLGVTLFALQTNNWIQWSPQSGSSWTPSNLKKVFSRGLELTFKNQIKVNKVVLKTHFNYQLSRATEIGDVLNLQLIYAPIHAGSMGISLIYKDFYVNYYQNASSKRRMIGDFTQPFTLANTTIGHSFLIHKYRLNTALQIANIWNADYEVIRFYAQPRRSFEGQLNLIF
jgi:vitamin B12 transporter